MNNLAVEIINNGKPRTIFENGVLHNNTINDLDVFQTIFTIRLVDITKKEKIDDSKKDHQTSGNEGNSGYSLRIIENDNSEDNYAIPDTNLELVYDLYDKNKKVNNGTCTNGIFLKKRELQNDYESKLSYKLHEGMLINKTYYLVRKCHVFSYVKEPKIPTISIESDFVLKIEKWTNDVYNVISELHLPIKNSFSFHNNRLRNQANLQIEFAGKPLKLIKDDKIKKYSTIRGRHTTAFHLSDINLTTKNSEDKQLSHVINFAIKATKNPLMINSITFISLEKEFLIENRFEKRLYDNHLVEPDIADSILGIESFTPQGTIHISVNIQCLVTKHVKGKILVSIFPEELYVIDVKGNCVANQSIINLTRNLDLKILRPLVKNQDIDYTPPMSLDNDKTYFVKPNESCIFKADTISAK